jgi:imidazolonepropionase
MHQHGEPGSDPGALGARETRAAGGGHAVGPGTDRGEWILGGIGQLVTMDGEEAGQAGPFSVAAADALLVTEGRIAAIGRLPDLERDFPQADVRDAGGRLVTPGLVDAHTHLIYAGHRAHEVALRARGATYLEILAAGGGILATVRATRAAGDSEILAATRSRLRHALNAGTTALEIKTGYDLTPDGELRLLGLVQQLKREGPQHIVTTFLGAHALPEEYRGRPQEFLRAMAAVHPAIRGVADFVDIFAEPGVFEVEEAREYLADAKAHGLPLKIHADELADSGGALLAAELGAVSADHLAHTGRAGIEALARSGTVAVLLPGTAGYLHQGAMANARAMVEAGVPVAIASDGNPGSSPTTALSLLMPWAASWLRLSPEEVWTGVTRFGARAIGHPELGRLSVGAPADFVIWDTDDYRMPCYEYGRNFVRAVYIGGRRVAGASG